VAVAVAMVVRAGSRTQTNKGYSWGDSILGKDISSLIPFCQTKINFC
jgi:hypothetical protein